MKRLFGWLNIIIKKRKELKRWQRIVTALAAVITFATTYALILPAITVERDNTEDIAGMYLEQKEAQDDLFLENALEFTGFSIEEININTQRSVHFGGQEPQSTMRFLSLFCKR